MGRATDFGMMVRLLGAFVTCFLVVAAVIAAVRPYWVWDRRWKAYATIAVVIVLGLFVPPPPNAKEEKPAAASVPVVDAPASGDAAAGSGGSELGPPVRIPGAPGTQDWANAPTWEYLPDPQGDGKVGKAACVTSLDDANAPETEGEVCISHVGKEVDAWLRDDNPKFSWGKKPSLEIQFDGKYPEGWDWDASDPPEVGLLLIRDTEGFEQAVQHGRELLMVVRFEDDSPPKVFRFAVGGLEVKRLVQR